MNASVEVAAATRLSAFHSGRMEDRGGSSFFAHDEHSSHLPMCAHSSPDESWASSSCEGRDTPLSTSCVRNRKESRKEWTRGAAFGVTSSTVLGFSCTSEGASLGRSSWFAAAASAFFLRLCCASKYRFFREVSG